MHGARVINNLLMTMFLINFPFKILVKKIFYLLQWFIGFLLVFLFL